MTSTFSRKHQKNQEMEQDRCHVVVDDVHFFQQEQKNTKWNKIEVVSQWMTSTYSKKEPKRTRKRMEQDRCHVAVDHVHFPKRTKRTKRTRHRTRSRSCQCDPRPHFSKKNKYYKSWDKIEVVVMTSAAFPENTKKTKMERDRDHFVEWLVHIHLLS